MTSQHPLVAHVLATVRRLNLFNAGDTLVVGLSGGADSTALLDILASLPGLPLRLVAAHLNHSLRGKDSDDDEQFCRELADTLRIPFESRRIDVAALAADHSWSIEDAGRRARQAFFEELVAARQARAIVVAHHADDQAETVLMRLLRGSGSQGLAAMTERNKRGYLRPLLDVTHRQIEEYLRERGLTWREDSSNRDQDYLRNRIRHELIPVLENYNPSIRERLAATAGLLADEHHLLDELARQSAAGISNMTSRGICCQTAALSRLHPALQRRVVRLMLEEVCGDLNHFGMSHIESIRALASGKRPNSTLSLPRGVTVAREYQQLFISAAPRPAATDYALTITGPGRYPLPDGATLDITAAVDHPVSVRHDPCLAYVDLERAPFPWLARPPRPGDRLQPLGMSGHKKLKDLFIDAKIPLHKRRRTPLVFCQDELIWVCGLRSSHICRIDHTSISIVSVQYSLAVSPETP